MLKFDKVLQSIICESIYSINDKVFKPFVYKGVLIAASMNNDPYHLTNRLKQRGKEYVLDDVFIIVKRGIDHYLNDKELKQFHDRTKSFSFRSKLYPNIIVSCTIEQNKLHDMFDIDSKDIFKSSKYICFIYTILDKDMKTKVNDKQVLTEEIGNEIILVDVE